MVYPTCPFYNKKFISKMAQIYTIQHAKISHEKIVIYNELIGIQRKGNTTTFSNKYKFQNTYSGVLTPHARKRIRRSLDMWFSALECKKFISRKGNDWMRYQVTFCTLTLPAAQMHTDKEVKRDMLNAFLIEIGRKENCRTYIWVAERQDNGNIHFHLLLNKFIEWRVIRTLWNSILDRHGYIEKYRLGQKEFHKEGFKVRTDLLGHWSLDAQLKAYEYGMLTNWSDPNSTDIESLKDVKNIGAYITKYVCKGIDQKVNEKLKERNTDQLSPDDIDRVKREIIDELVDKYRIEGKVWSQSTNLEKMLPCDVMIDSDCEEIIHKSMSNKNCKTIEKQQFKLILGTSLKELKIRSPCTWKQYVETQNNNYKLLYS